MSRQVSTSLFDGDNHKIETEQKNAEQNFVAAFERCTLPPEQFDHEGHVRISWLYLNNFPLDVAVEKVMVGIKTYAEHLGAKEKYHATLTWFMVYLLKSRISLVGDSDWPAFKSQNPDIFTNAKALVEQYYSQELLTSNEARLQPVAPDIKQPDWLHSPGSVK